MGPIFLSNTKFLTFEGYIASDSDLASLRHRMSRRPGLIISLVHKAEALSFSQLILKRKV